jgi:hypothetical protein
MNRIRRRNLALVCAALTLPLAALSVAGSATAAQGALALDLKMETHAAFFSAETKQPKPLDPQVFVRDAKAQAATGPQNIKHAAGFRAAPISESAKTALFNADGKPSGFTLGKWLGARGTVQVAADGQTVTVRLSGLQPKGKYSLFENHFDQQPIGFTPLDGSGKTNTFTAKADGKATVTVKVPETMTHANAVLLVYHSDHQAHGESRGEIGVNAHHELIARIP